MLKNKVEYFIYNLKKIVLNKIVLNKIVLKKVINKILM